jgi:hypothetical protein
MGSRQAVLLTPSKSSGTARLLSPLESTLIEVLILKSFKFFRMNTYEKHRGEGVLLLTTHPMRMRILSERSESKDLSSHPMRESVLRSIATKDLSTHPMRIAVLSAPSFSGSESAAADESEDLSSHEESSFNQALRPGEPLFHRSPACPEPAVVGGVASHPLAQTLSGPLAGRIFAAAPEGASHVRSHQTCHGHADSHRVR